MEAERNVSRKSDKKLTKNVTLDNKSLNDLVNSLPDVPKDDLICDKVTENVSKNETGESLPADASPVKGSNILSPSSPVEDVEEVSSASTSIYLSATTDVCEKNLSTDVAACAEDVEVERVLQTDEEGANVVENGVNGDESISPTVPDLDEDLPPEEMKDNTVTDGGNISKLADMIYTDRLYPSLPMDSTAPSLDAEAPPLESFDADYVRSLKEPTAPTASAPMDDAVLATTDLVIPPRQEIILSSRKTLRRVYPELALDEIDVQPYSEKEILSMNQGVLMMQKEAVEDKFIDLYSEHNFTEHELYKLLNSYYKERTELTRCEAQVQALLASCAELSNDVWSIGKGQVSAYDRCGDNQRIEKSHEYCISTFEAHRARKLADNLKELTTVCKGKHAMTNHCCQVLKGQVEQALNNILFAFRCLRKDAPVPKIGDHIWGREQEEAKEPLRVVISILFSIARRPFEDNEFVKQIRQWVHDCCSVLLRVASLEDHFFLLSHVLRCPPGIHKWAIDLVQVPPIEEWPNDQNWEDYEFEPAKVFDYSLMVLTLMCNPVKKRDEFLSMLKVMAEDVPTESWCIVDSEGEDEANNHSVFLNWNESDIIELLNQLPFQKMFKYMMLVNNVYDNNRANEKQILKLIAFSSHLVNILHQGLRTYHEPRYKNLCKLLSRLIRHCVEYLSDHWESFRADKERNASLMRLQVEYDQLLLRAVNSIFYSESLGAWQFMAALPYANVSNGIMWQLLWLLHNNYKEDIELVDMSPHDICKHLQQEKKLEEKIEEMDESEVFYLLNAFANMAISRDEKGHAFIHTVAVEVFEISYINVRMRETHSKVGRDLLSRLAQKHPFVVSVLLDQIHQHIDKVGVMACYLFNDLDLTKWLPDNEDLDILFEFITEHDLSSPHNTLARLVLQNMNYGFDEKNGQLFLNESHHQKVGLILLEAYKKHYLPFDKTGYGYRQFKYLSDYALGTKQSATPDGFIQYLWDLLLRLQIHVFDYPHPGQLRLITDEDPPIGLSLSLDNSEWLEPLRQGVFDSLPPAIYLALMMCNEGHYREQILSKGCSLLWELVQKEQFTAAVEAIHRVSTVFICKPSLIIENTKFLQSLELIMQADNTYAAMFKNLVTNTFPGDILTHLVRVIVEQVRKAKAWNLQTKTVIFWLELLFNLPEMSLNKGHKVKCRESVLFVLDSIVQLAYHEVGCIDKVIEYLEQSLTNVSPTSGSSASVMRTMFSYVLGSGSSWPILTPLPSCRQFPWFAWAGLIAETNLEQNKVPWKSIIKEMATNHKSTLEQALKVVSTHNKNVPSPEFLLIFRWATQALDTDLDHPALPLIWQQFFQLYLQRSEANGSVGLRLFEGPVYHPILKLLKKRLNELAEHFHRKHGDLAKNLQAQPLSDHTKETARALMQMQEVCELFSKLQKYFRTLYLWLEEPRLHDVNVALLALPPQYNPEMLRVVLTGKAEIWSDLVHVEIIEENLERLSEKKRGQKTNQHRNDLQKEEVSIETRILKRLKCYDDGRPAPSMVVIRQIPTQVTLEMMSNASRILSMAENELKTLKGQARSFNAQTIHLSNLNENYRQYLKHLYTNEEREMQLFMACNLGPKCKQHAKLVFKFKEATKSKVSDREISENRTEWAAIISDIRSPPTSAVINACSFIECCIVKIANDVRSNSDRNSHFREIGSKLFAFLVRFMDNDCLEHAPTKQFLLQCLDILGECIICPDPKENIALLDLVLRNPHLISYLAPYFSPIVCTASAYTEMYDKLCQNLGPTLYECVFILLTKFDLESYLRAKQSSALDRQNLLGTLEKALHSIGKRQESTAKKIEEVYLHHMKILLVSNNYEHHIQVLQMLLNGVKLNNIPSSTFEAFFEAIKSPQMHVSGDMAVHASTLCIEAVRDSIKLISDFFKDFRRTHQSAQRNGLYSVCENYIPQISALNKIMCDLFIGYNCEKMCRYSPSAAEIDAILQAIFDIYEPWLEMLQIESSLFTPWLPGQLELSQVMLKDYIECLALLEVNLNRVQCSILNNIWQRYFTSYVWNDCASYVTSQYSSEILNLPWEQFFPNVADLRLMTKLLEPKYSDHLSFLSMVFLRINWARVLEAASAFHTPADVKSETISRFLELLTKTAWDEGIIKSKMTPSLCHSVREANIDWNCVPIMLVRDFLLIFRLSCDPLCILLADEDSQDDSVLSILSMICCLDVDVRKIEPSPATTEKQAAYVDMAVRLLHKDATTPSSQNLVKNRHCVLQFIPKHLNLICKLTEPKQAIFSKPAALILRDLLNIFNLIDNQEWIDVLTEGLVSWIDENPASPLILPTLSVVSSHVENAYVIPRVCESCICAYSKSEEETYSSDGGWNTILNYMTFRSNNPDLLDAIIKNALSANCFLTLYSYVLYKLPQCESLDKELNLLRNMVDWMVDSVPKSEESEPKVLLLWDKLLLLSLRQLECEGDNKLLFIQLQRLVEHLLQMGEDKVPSGILGAFGFGTRSPFSIVFRYNCRVLAAIISCFLTDDGMVLSNKSSNNDHKPHNIANVCSQKVKSMKDNKLYLKLSREVETAIQMVNPKDFMASQNTVKSLVNLFYPTVSYLKVLFFGVL